MIYDYVCNSCGFSKEELVKTPDAAVPCEQCENTAMFRKFPAPSLGRLNTASGISNALRKRSLADAKRNSEEYAGHGKRQLNKAIKKVQG